MEHVGIDLGGRKSQVCIRDAKGRVLVETSVSTKLLGEYVKKRPRSRVVMETCAEAFFIARQVKAAGHVVHVVPATLVKSLGVGARGVKTDVRDAQVLSEVSSRMEKVPAVHIPSVPASEVRALLNARDSLVTARTQLVNAVRGNLRTRLVKPRGTPETFVERVPEALLETAEGMSSHTKRHLKVIAALNQALKEADKELSELAESNDICKLLMTAPGVGPVVATRMVSAVDDISRFKTAHALESYLGLTPGERSSGQKQRRTGLTKAGPTAVRSALVQGCWTILRVYKDEPMHAWAMQVAERRGKKVAVCALARKLVGILFAMWRDNTPYDSTRQRSEVTATN